MGEKVVHPIATDGRNTLFSDCLCVQHISIETEKRQVKSKVTLLKL